jgi:hypothetical protein
MSDIQFLRVLEEKKQVMHPFATPELDENLGRAWKEKNRAKDSITSAHRRRVLVVLVTASSVVPIVLFAGAIA